VTPAQHATALIERVGGLEKTRELRDALVGSIHDSADYLQRVSKSKDGSETLLAWAIMGTLLAELAYTHGEDVEKGME